MFKLIDVDISVDNQVDGIYHWTQQTEEDHFYGVVSPQGTIIASAVGSTLTFWDICSGKELKEIPAHKENITRLCFSPDGTLVCTASDDNSLRLWRVPGIPKWTHSRSGDVSVQALHYRDSVASGSKLTSAHVHSSYSGT